MKKVTVVSSLVLVMFMAGIYLWTTNQQNLTDQDDNIDAEFAKDKVAEEAEAPIEGRQMYVNEEWGFSFAYPEDWEVKENTFRAATSLFNVVVQSLGVSNSPRPVIVNVITNEWGTELLNEATISGDVVRKKIGDNTFYVSDTTDLGLSATSYMVRAKNFWFDIIIKKDQEDLRSILDSFKFTN